MYKASQLVAFAKSMLGMPYWYGTVVYRCTEDLRKRKAKQYASHYKSSRTSRYRSDIAKKYVCMDCIGLIKGFFWTNGGVGVVQSIGTGKSYSSKYAGNGCPDKSADGMLRWCKSKGARNGKISTLPDVPGVLLFSSGHVGVYIGGGYAIEARGFNYGVVKTKVSARGWKNWSFMPSSLLEYDTMDGNVPDVPVVSQSLKLGDRLIERGVEGDDVAELQKALKSLGYNLGTDGPNKDGIDGDCGPKTEKAIKKFQADNGLEADGQYGKLSHAKMMTLVVVDTGTFEIEVTGGSVNVRTKPNTKDGKIVDVVHRGDKLDAVETDKDTGWYKLENGNYISNKYTKKI